MLVGSFGPPPNLHKCISLVEVYRFGQCLGKIFFPMSIFFSPAYSRTLSEARSQTLLTSLFKDASFSPLLNIQRVFHLWKSIYLNSAWVDIFNDVNLFFSCLF